MKFLKLLALDFFLAAIPPFVIVVLQASRMYILPSAGYLDAVAHFFGGSSIALSALILWIRWHGRAWFDASPLVRDYAIVMTSLFVGTMWEWWEFWMQRWTGDVYQPSMGDTMQDLFMDTIGGLLTILIFRLLKKGFGSTNIEPR